MDTFDDILYKALQEVWGNSAKKPPYNNSLLVPIGTIKRMLENQGWMLKSS